MVFGALRGLHSLLEEERFAMQTQQLNVTGMTCGGCVGKVTRALNEVSGVRDAKVSLPTGATSVEYDERLTSPDQLKAAVQRAGYGVGAEPGSPTRKGGCCS